MSNSGSPVSAVFRRKVTTTPTGSPRSRTTEVKFKFNDISMEPVTPISHRNHTALDPVTPKSHRNHSGLEPVTPFGYQNHTGLEPVTPMGYRNHTGLEYLTPLTTPLRPKAMKDKVYLFKSMMDKFNRTMPDKRDLSMITSQTSLDESEVYISTIEALEDHNELLENLDEITLEKKLLKRDLVDTNSKMNEIISELDEWKTQNYSLEEKNIRLEKQLHVLQKELEEKDHAIQKKDQTIYEKDLESCSKNEAIQEKDQAIQERNQAIRDKDQLIQSIRKTEKSLEESQSKLSKVIAESEELVMALAQAHAKIEQLESNPVLSNEPARFLEQPKHRRLIRTSSLSALPNMSDMRHASDMTQSQCSKNTTKPLFSARPKRLPQVEKRPTTVPEPFSFVLREEMKKAKLKETAKETDPKIKTEPKPKPEPKLKPVAAKPKPGVKKIDD